MDVKMVKMEVEGGKTVEVPISQAEYDNLMAEAERQFGKKPVEIKFYVQWTNMPQ